MSGHVGAEAAVSELREPAGLHVPPAGGDNFRHARRTGPDQGALADTAAEQTVLGALLANNRVYDRVGTFLAPEHFAEPVNARIYAAMVRHIERGQRVDAMTLAAEFEAAGTLAELGGATYLVQLLTAMVGAITAGEYRGSVGGAWIGRLLVDAGATLLGDEAAAGAHHRQEGAAFQEDAVLLDLATHAAHRLVGLAGQDDDTTEREARLLLDRINTGLDAAHARADRLLARLN